MLVYLDSFETYNTTLAATRWNSFGGNTFISTTQFRSGSQSLLCSGTNGGLAQLNVPNQTTYTCGAAIFLQSLTGTNRLFSFFDSGSEQVSVRMDGGGTLYASRNGTTLGVSTYTMPFNQWRYVEFSATISNTVGTIEVRVDGATVLSLTGQDTQNTSNAQINQVFVSTANGQQCYFDDFYITDATGSVNTGFLGDIKVVPQFPNAAGSFTVFTRGGVDSGANWSQVDEAIPNTTDWVESGGIGDRDSYNFADLSIIGTIYGVQLSCYAAKDDAGTRAITLNARSGGTDGSSSSLPLSTTFAFYIKAFDTDPNTSAAWTLSGLNAAEFGVSVAS